MKVAIIGGGPSGLVTLKHIVHADKYFDLADPITVRLFEREQDIGGTFRYRTYADSELVSSKYLTAFSDYRFPPETPDFVTPDVYLKYLQGYVHAFELDDYIECGTTVVNVRRTSGRSHIVTISSAARDGVGIETEEWECDAVVMCAGLNVTPSQPEIDGVPLCKKVAHSDVPQDKCMVTIHSSEYKSARAFDGADNVVILGAGETAMDLAYQARNHPDVKKVVICNRDGFLIAPKITPEPVILGFWGKPYPGKRPNKPIDTTIASLFDTMYVPGLLQRGPLLWLFYDRWIKYIFFLIAGTSQGIDQWVGGLPPRRRYADGIFLVKSDKAVPYMSAGQRRGIFNAIRSFFINVPIKDVGDRVIEVKAWPTHMDEGHNLHIPEHGSDVPYKIRPDRLIFATGYRTDFPFLERDQYPSLAEAKFRRIYRDIGEGFAYIGFVRPSIGAIPPLAELQAQLWVERYLREYTKRKLFYRSDPPRTFDPAGFRLDKPADESAIGWYELDFALHARGSRDPFRTKGGVDHESYAFQLALDMGAAPSFRYVLTRTSWKCLYTWAMGPNFNSKFRLVGPWARPGQAREVIEGELFNVVKRTGGLFFFTTYTLAPFLLVGALSLVLFLGEYLWHLLKLLAHAVKSVAAGLLSPEPDRLYVDADGMDTPLTEAKVFSYF